VDEDLARALQATLDEQRALHGLPGVSAAVSLPDGALWSGAGGEADRRTGRPLKPDTPMAIASVTKTFVAALVLELAEEGRLSLDDPLSRWLPRYPDARAITVRQLLNHTSGLFGVDENEAYTEAVDRDPDRRWTPADTLRYVERPYFAPGRGWHYSDTNYVLLGQVIQRATGSTVAQELHQRLLDELGLQRIVLQPDEPAPPHTAHGHGGPGPENPGPGRYVPYTSIASTEWTSAAMIADAPALARWGRALFAAQAITPASLKQMTDFVPADMIGYEGYGLGVGRRHTWRLDGDLWGAVGLFPGFGSDLWYSPDIKTTVAVLWIDPTNYRGSDIADALLDTVRRNRRPR
jgi:D-alanyl-D-alanine carboxypeptidase